jgi:predicted nucleic acid-binding protein
MTAYLVDTNALLRWARPSDPSYPAVVAAIDRVLARGDIAYGCPQALIELWSVLTRPSSSNG